MDYWRGLAREYLARQGLAPSPELLERIKPMTMTQSAELFIRTFGLSGTPQTLAGEMNAMIEAHYRGDIPLKEGVDVYKRQLRGRPPAAGRLRGTRRAGPCPSPPPHRREESQNSPAPPADPDRLSSAGGRWLRPRTSAPHPGEAGLGRGQPPLSRGCLPGRDVYKRQRYDRRAGPERL